MTIYINGLPLVLDRPISLADLLARQHLDRGGIAVALNREVVQRRHWASVEVKEGERVEILQAVAGG